MEETYRKYLDDENLSYCEMEKINEIDRRLYKMKKKFRIACFTESNTSSLMWAHYVDSHGITGVYIGLKSFEYYKEKINKPMNYFNKSS